VHRDVDGVIAMSEQPAASGPGGAPDGVVAGPARALALVGAGLGLLIYLLGFFGEVSVTSSFGGPLLLAGGLLAGTAALPRAGRVLVPAAVLTVTGTLLLLQLATGIGGPAVVIVALVLACAEAGVVVTAAVLDAGPGTRSVRRPPAPPYPSGYGGYPPAVGPAGYAAGAYPRTSAAIGPDLDPSGPAAAAYAAPGDPATGSSGFARPGQRAEPDAPPEAGHPPFSDAAGSADTTTFRAVDQQTPVSAPVPPTTRDAEPGEPGQPARPPGPAEGTERIPIVRPDGQPPT
jgi:hypothetical protein